MIVCEYFFENFDALGDDEYLDMFSGRLDEFLAAGWTLLDSRRDAAYGGWWRVELFKARVPVMERTSTRSDR
jgi:hypothetical protein